MTENKLLSLASDIYDHFVIVYDQLYKQKQSGNRYDVNRGDEIICNHKPLMETLIELHEDIFSSDREVAALAIAYDFVTAPYRYQGCSCQ